MEQGLKSERQKEAASDPSRLQSFHSALRVSSGTPTRPVVVEQGGISAKVGELLYYITYSHSITSSQCARVYRLWNHLQRHSLHVARDVMS